MAKDKKKKREYHENPENSQNIVAAITERVKGKGKIKGKNKKETKVLKACCPHHIIDGKCRFKPKIIVTEGRCRCKLCGAEFTPNLKKEAEVLKEIAHVVDMVQHAKFISIAAYNGKKSSNIDQAPIKWLGELQIKLNHFAKLYIKLTRLVQKNQTKNKKKKSYSDPKFGEWRA